MIRFLSANTSTGGKHGWSVIFFFFFLHSRVFAGLGSRQSSSSKHREIRLSLPSLVSRTESRF
jgi:hypothetical protein